MSKFISLFILFLTSIVCVFAQNTVVSTVGNQWYINGKLTYEGRYWEGKKIEGLLMNSRMVQGVFDDLTGSEEQDFKYPDTGKWDAQRNNNEFVANMSLWKSYGLNCFTLNMQGGSPTGYGNPKFQNTGYYQDGSLHPGYMNRLDKILKKADELNMVVILGLFYFGQDQNLNDEQAVVNAVRNITNWLFDHKYRNVIIEINNETLGPNRYYEQEILQFNRVHELINLVKSIERNGYRYLVSTSFPAQSPPTSNVVEVADYILFHANALRQFDKFKEHIVKVRKAVGDKIVPLVINEDDNHHFEKDTAHIYYAIDQYISWGFFDYRRRDNPNLNEGYQTIPVDWGINSIAKRDFFNTVSKITGIKPNRKESQIGKQILIDSVWAANRVPFDIQTVGYQQYVAYYDSERNMTVASRTLGSNSWTKKTLPNKLRWDSHNYVTLAVDTAGYIHVTGNMHNDPLAYFKSSKPYDVASMEEVNKMVGKHEQDVTYPKFFYDKNRSLYFSYRSGSSGNGNTFVNKYDAENQTWSRYLDTPLFEGKSDTENRSAYHQLTQDKEGNFHLTWLWRWSPEVETCHQLSYAFSKDFKNWYGANGESLTLPLRPDTPTQLVDNTPTKGGMHNGKYNTTITPDQKPIIVYQKYDIKGMTQLYLAAFKNNKWQTIELSKWNFRWKFIGGGDKMGEGAIYNIMGFNDQGHLVIEWTTPDKTSGTYTVDIKQLKLVPKSSKLMSFMPASLNKKITPNPKLKVNTEHDGTLDKGYSTRYLLKWETQKRSHGSSAPKVIPVGPLSPLYLIELKQY